MSQSLIVKLAGLFTNSNLLSAVPEGALSVADNIVIDKNSLAESRRGFSQLVFGLPSLSDRADKLFQYQNTLLVHYNSTVLAYYDPNAGIQPYTGSFSHPDPALAKIRSAEANQNLYFTSTSGIQKLDSYNHTPSAAGMPAALDCTATLVSAQSFNASSLSGNSVTANSHGYTTGVPGSVASASGVLPTGLLTTYTFTCSTASATIGATYTNSGKTYTVAATIAGALVLNATGTSAPGASGTLTKASGTGDATITYSAFVASGLSVYYTIVIDPNTLQFASSYANALAGTPIALSGGSGSTTFTPTMVANATSFLGQVQVGYRVLWGKTDANNNLVLGAPSYQTVITNGTGSNQNVSLQITIPAGITTGNFLQVYRSSQSTNTTTVPLDDGQLVYETAPTAANITALSITIIDVVPDSLRGAALYTNASQEGILQANSLPPYAQDLTVFRDCLFFANTQSVQLLQISILSVSGTYGIQVGDTITIGTNVFTAVGSAPVSNSNNYLLATSGSVAQNINDTAINLVRTINQSTLNTTIYAYYVSSTGGLPGQILLQARSLGSTAFALTSSNGLTAFSPALPSTGTSVLSSNSTNLNGLMYSKQQIPDAVPTTNILYPGSASKKILRILALRSSLFILKEDGVYRVTGNDPSTFAIDLIDNTAILIAPESAVTLNNQIFALSTQGVVAISDTGVQIMSDPIQDQIINLISTAPTEVQSYSFGVGYESERLYLLWMPAEAGDTTAHQAFAYNYLTKAWTRWSRTQQHAIVLSADNKIYAADPNTSYINQERKNGIYTDYSDEAYVGEIVSVSGLTIGLADIENALVGDILFQSIAQTSVIAAVDVGASTVTVSDSVTWSLPANFTSGSVSGNSITVPAHGYSVGQLVTLTTAATLPTGLAVNTSYYVIVIDANTIQLATSSANAAAGTAIVLSGAGSGSSTVVPTAFTLRAIPCTVEWIPNPAQNAGLLKQWTEATLLMRENYFDTASINFYSDVDGSIEGIQFTGATTGGWGQFPWGFAPWGESARSLPFRTYVPLNKQRCTLLSVQFVCINAWARFQLEGLSLAVRGVSTRSGS